MIIFNAFCHMLTTEDQLRCLHRSAVGDLRLRLVCVLRPRCRLPCTELACCLNFKPSVGNNRSPTTLAATAMSDLPSHGCRAVAEAACG
jgi:hypothetical protein